MIIRNTRPEDLDEVADLHARSIAALCKAHYTEAQIAAWTGLLRPEIYESAITDKVFVLAEQPAIVGMGILDPKAGRIDAIYVAPEAAGTGVGSAILAELEHAARDRGLAGLTTFATLNATQFYVKRGYAEQGSAFHDLPDGTRLECVEMRKGF